VAAGFQKNNLSLLRHRNSSLAQQLHYETISVVKQPSASSRLCAAAVMEAVPHLMRVLRARVRSDSSPDLSMPQFRALAFIGRNEGAMLADVGNFLALAAPAASKLIDGLVCAGLVAREPGSKDRRRIELKLTAAGHRKYVAALKTAEDYISERIAPLSALARAEILRALNTLHAIFDDPPEVRRAAKRNGKS
jgi:DNA-binding MarR family transcriptional regulator